MSEAKRLIDSRQLDSAEKMIVGEMMTAPQDADWITLLAQVRLGQNRTREDREGAIAGLLAAGHHELADLMQAALNPSAQTRCD